ncbi:unnamed protein product [Caenorhabditis sp. 36 PRJEB53466]|nr:unnamed protein product [Caenorhabditis sp. 36 PRJEB53466]
MRELYVAECMAEKAQLEVETDCRKLIADNYEEVHAQAQEYSKKVEAPILAKICEVGYFCDAHVVRTNVLTLELGSEFFVECSVQNAKKIVARRAAEMRKQREDGLETIRLLNEKIKFAAENFSSVKVDGGPLEIVEKYDEEMEKRFYDNRKKRKEEQANGIGKKEDEKSAEDKKAVELMNRLDELELLEETNAEIEKVIREEVPVPKPFEMSAEDLVDIVEYEEDEEKQKEITQRLLAQPGVSQKEMEALLKYLDECDQSSDEDNEEVEEEEEEQQRVEELDSDDYASDEDVEKVIEKKEIVDVALPRKKSGVRFSHQLEEVKTFRHTDTIELKEESPIETKSILRNTEPTPVDRSALEPEQKELAAMSAVSFPGEIVEKNPYECQPSTSKDPAPVITEKKVSKFRASRNKN